MAQNMEELLGIPTLSGFGVDTGLDMDYLMGGGEDQGENASDLGSSVSDDGDSNDSGEKANKKKSEGTFAVPMKRGISRKGANMGSSIPNQRSSRSSIKLDLIDMERFIKDNPNVEYKIPVLFRSKKGGIRFRMSEILYPRNPKIIEENLEYNYKQMENKLLDLNKEANYENQKKLKDDLKPREENLLKAIRESSIRELLKDYIYLHSDLSLASNYSMIKEKKKQDLKKKQYCRNIPKLKRDFKRSRMLRELDEKKRDEEERKEREEKEKLEKSKAKFTQPSENDIPTITFALRKENLLLTTAERANALNEICKDLNKESLEKDTKKEPINLTSEEQKKFEMKPFRWNIPDLTPEELKDIKRNADTSQLYPKEEESNDQNLKDLTVKYLSNINPTTWAPQVTSNTPNEENKGELDVQMEEKDEDNNSKNEDDDLFMADTNKEQKAIKDDLFEDDPFAEQDPKHDDIDDDFFAEEKDNKNSNAGGGSDEGIFDEKDDKEENKDQNKQAKKDTEKEVVGDFFTEKLKFVHPMEKDSSKDKTPKSFRYFGELQDVDSIYQRKYDNRRNLKKFHKEIKDPVFKSVKSKENTTLVRSLSLEKGRSDDVSNKTLSERMIFNNISMYKFRNKKLDGPLKLGLLTKGKYEMKNSSNKLEKLELASEVDARRKAFKYEYVENMDSQYERDVLRILKKNTSKKENDKYAFEIQDPEKASDKNKSPIIQNTEDYDSKELDEISSIDSDTIEEERKYKVRDGVFGGVSNTLTSSSTTSDLLQHAQCFKFEHFDIENFTRFHRPDLGETFKEISQEKGTNNNNEMSTREKLAMQIAGSNYALENRLRNKILSLPIILSCNRRLKKKLKKTGIRNAYEYFSSRSKLTLKQGKFLVFEHIDQHPLFINNYGMASRLKRYVYSDSLLPLKYFKEPPKGMAQTRHIGYYGQQILLKDDDKLPLIGQIDRKKYQGLAVLENNMYIAPVTYQKPKTTDFVCITHVNNKGKREMHLREMKQIYTVGQLEPKEEVFAPQSRNYNVFLKNRVRAFALRLIQNRPRQKISFYEMRKCFPIFNEQVLKKTLKDSHISVNMDQTCYLSTDQSIEDLIKNLITPENTCQYESCEFGVNRLYNLGIERITNANKITFATEKFCSEETDPYYKRLAMIIKEEVLCTPWNLSQNFINNQQSNGMMTLKGIGDPSRGYGGYSYLKLPLKMSQDSLNKEAVASKSVTGTEADLRTLSKEQIHEYLIGFGYDKQFDISKIGRWDGVKILRDHSSKAASFGVAGTFKKFARGSRMTSKMQREGYQDQIDEIFDTQLKYIANPDPEIESGSDIESSKEEEGLKTMMKDSVQKGMKSSQKEAESKENNKDENNMGDIKTYLESDKVKDINSIHDIPGYNKEFRENMKDFVDSFKEGSHECTVLKKVITSINSITNKPEKRIVYIFDDRHIKSFRKRIEKCKGKRRSKPKKNLRDTSVFGLSKSKNDNSNISFRLAPDVEEGDIESYRSGYESSKFSLRKDKKENKISLKIIGEERKEEDDDQDYGKISFQTGDASGRNKKKDAQKKQSKPKKNNEDIYLNPPKKPVASSRRRQNTPLSQLNNGVFVNLVDSCITFDNTRIFHDPVKKADFPTYYEMVKNPIDLNKIKSKAKRCEYMSLEEFKKDMYLLKTNSVIFNGNDSFVTKQAEHILERLETLINLEKSEIESLEQKVKEDKQQEEN